MYMCVCLCGEQVLQLTLAKGVAFDNAVEIPSAVVVEVCGKFDCFDVNEP